MSGEWIDRTRPEWPRYVHQNHLDADEDHAPAPHSLYGDGISDVCGKCRLSTTSDGKRHGWDAS